MDLRNRELGHPWHALRDADQPLVLVNYLEVKWSTRRHHETATIITGLRKDNRRYALVVSYHTARNFDLRSLRESNIQLFVCTSENHTEQLEWVKDWLVGHPSGDLALQKMAPEKVFGARAKTNLANLRPIPLQERNVTDTADALAYARLTFHEPQGSHTYLMSKDEIVVGRDAPDLWLDYRVDATIFDISREHFRIRRTPDRRFMIKDMSKLGTTISGAALPPSLRREGDNLRDLDHWVDLPEKARIGLAEVVFADFEILA